MAYALGELHRCAADILGWKTSSSRPFHHQNKLIRMMRVGGLSGNLVEVVSTERGEGKLDVEGIHVSAGLCQGIRDGYLDMLPIGRTQVW